MKKVVGVACALAALAACSSDPATPNTGAGGTGGPSGGAGMRASGGASGGGTAAGGTSGSATGGATSGAPGSATGGVPGSATGGAPGTGGASSGAASERAACFEYVEAFCARHSECTGRSLSNCLELRDQCPDSMFSPGTTRTAASLSACAAAWTTVPCGEARTGGAPPCATLGTRPEGATCAFPSQCATGFCTENGGAKCGTCGPVSDVGGACIQGQQGCKRGLACTNGVCSPHPTEAPGAVAAPMEICSDPATMIAKTCTDGHLCGRFSESEPYRCHPRPGAGSPCLNSDCGPGAHCVWVNSTQICQALPPIGQPCAERSPAVERCALDAYCSGSTCVRRIAIGATCSDSDPFMCDGATACFEDDTSGEERCLRPREEGESCGASDRCNPGTACTAGVCKANGLLGLFAAACGP